jgi:ubiquinone/menaquinone biosynthesis C-methylase UbiE
MDVAEFDRFADEYDAAHRRNVQISGEAPEYFAEYKIRVFSRILRHLRFSGDQLLDFGSGIGNTIPHVQAYLPQMRLTCADVSQRSLDIARARFGGAEADLLITGKCIPAADCTFDAAFSACVFHHIPHEEHVAWLSELRRVTRPGGVLAIFEHNPLNFVTVGAVETCPFDVNARLILAKDLARRCQEAGWDRTVVRYHLFFPRPLAILRPLERRLEWLPLGAQYSVVAS